VQHMPCVAEAFERGDLDTLRVRHLAGAREVDTEVFARDEAMLVDTIVGLPARDARTALDYWRQAAAPEATDIAEQRAHDLRRLFVSPTWGGLVRVDGQLGREAGAVVMAALDSLTDPGALDPTDTRSAPQRRADALTDLCRDHLDHGDAPVAGGEKPHVTLHVTRRTLRGEPDEPCELEEAGVVTPRTARRIACDASIIEITEEHAGAALDVGRRTRVVPAATRRALVARDRGCVICGRPARWCDAHHVVHWADGGPTSLDNLVLLCRFHHRGVHEGRTLLPAPVIERARDSVTARAPPLR